MRLRDDSGFTIMELLMAMTISLVLLGAALTSFDLFMKNTSVTVKTDEALARTRNGVDQMARQLRNLANPTNSGSSIDRATSYDFVFQTSDPSKRRVRYCLQSSPGGTNDIVWFQTAAGTGPMTPEMTATCPGTGWDKRVQVATQIVNRINGADRRVFSYGCHGGTPGTSWCAGSASTYERIVSARVDLYLDVNGSGKVPDAVRMSSAVYLRNQNEQPTASIAPVSSLGRRTVLLNASASSDPEGRTMQYQWFKGAGTLPAPDCAGGPLDQGTIGTGVTLTYVFPDADPSPQQIRLRVIDAGCLWSVAGPISVAIP